ncbi:Type III restriction protein res subunit (fragment) [Thiocapsa sp. KS1]
MPYNEPETRFYLIDPKLRAKGYDDPTRLRLETPAPVDIEGPKGRRRKGPGRTDYLICIEIGAMPAPLPVGLIEAKRETADPLSGMEQGKGYGDCRRFSIHYVFATNGHRYGEFDKISGLTTGPHDFDLFPTHAELAERYARDTGIDLSEPAANLLFTSDSPAYAENPRYYQSAAIRAVIAKILHCERDGLPARALLVLATGSGKTIVAANLLHRLNQAGRLAKPALFLCDRDELRQQALGKLRNVFKDSARIVTSDRGENSARNARIQIATYQTLGLDDDAKDVASFLTRHYPEPNSFSVIIIDECHRSAWNRWRVVLERNPDAIQIGLTATPRQLREPKRQRREDQDITANNLAYFGPPVYEYDLIQAQEDGYLAACEIVRRAVSLDGETFTDAEVVLKKGVDIRTGKRVKRDALKPKYDATRFDNDLVIPERIAAMCKDLFEQLCANGGPEQKVIVFCTRDLHADRVAMQLNNAMRSGARRTSSPPRTAMPSNAPSKAGPS